MAVPSHLRRHAKAAHKHVKLKQHHARPYRKRHLLLLIFSLGALFVFGAVLISYREQIVGGFASSRSFVSDLFSQNTNNTVNVNSSYGFAFSYDQNKFYGSAVDAATGDLYIGSELAAQHPYSVVRIAPTNTSNASNSRAAHSSALTFTYHPGGNTEGRALDALALQDGDIDATKVTRVTTVTSSIGGATFQKNTWQSRDTSILNPTLSPKFVTYSGVVNGDAVTIVLNLGVGSGDDSLYQNILDSITFNNPVGFKASQQSVAVTTRASRSLLDELTNTNIAAAASPPSTVTGSEKVAALYSPAVTKIYNAYCMDIALDGKVIFKNACDAEAGSGFFVSQDGYLGTNGHVVSNQPIDVAITQAYNYYSSKGDPVYLNQLLAMTDFKVNDVPQDATDAQALAIIFDKLYGINASRVTGLNKIENILVQVTSKNPDVTTLLKNTENRQPYTDKSVLPATVVATNYRKYDGYDGFKDSDVAIIKVSGEDFPITKLGEIDDVAQGADLLILGYPGNASDNGIVDTTTSTVTLTTGKVSSLKTADKSTNRLIETDTTIGHGNSGGPALDDDGKVVGIATYTADGSGTGNGTFNYIRDIKDLKDLASVNNISFDTNSATQNAWEQGVAYFYTSHYSQALGYFKTVQKLYPNDARVDEFIAASEKRIANGEDVVDFPIIPVIVIGAVLLLGVGLGIFFIVRHAKKHAIYMAGVAQGTVVPAGKNSKPQRVFVSRSGPTVDTPLVLSTAPAVAPTVPNVVPPTPPVASQLPQVVSDSHSSNKPKQSEEEPTASKE